jgi:hypothetical protein
MQDRKGLIMKKIIVCVALAVVILGIIILCFVKCSKDSPSAVVVKYIEFLNEGQYEDAKSVIAESEMTKIFLSDTLIREYGEKLTGKKNVKQIQIIKEKIEDKETATVKFKVVHKDGSSIEGKYTLVKLEDEWKIDGSAEDNLVEKTAEENKKYKNPGNLEGWWTDEDQENPELLKVDRNGTDYLVIRYHVDDVFNYDSTEDIFTIKLFGEERFVADKNSKKGMGPWHPENTQVLIPNITKRNDVYFIGNTQGTFIKELNKLLTISETVKDEEEWKDDGSLTSKDEKMKLYYYQEDDIFIDARKSLEKKFKGRTETKESPHILYKRAAAK